MLASISVGPAQHGELRVGHARRHLCTPPALRMDSLAAISVHASAGVLQQHAAARNRVSPGRRTVSESAVDEEEDYSPPNPPTQTPS